MGASPALKNTEDSFFGAAVNEMDPLFCGWRDPRKSWVSGWILGSALLSWTGVSTLHCPWGVQFLRLLCAQIESIWRNQKDPCNPKVPVITLVLAVLCVLKQQTLLSIHCTRFTPKEAFRQNDLCEVWVSCALETSLKFCEICYMWSTKLISQFLAKFSNKLSRIYCSWVFLINSKYRCSCSWREKSVFLIWIT